MSTEKDEKLLVGVGTGLTKNDPPTIILGMPKAAWEYMKDGKTHTIDMTKIGIPVRIMMYGADDHEHAKELMIEAATAAGAPIVGDGDRDLGFDDPTTH